MNKPTIPSTLDQIIDGSTRKLSDYLPLAGGTMNVDASINILTALGNQGVSINSMGVSVYSPNEQSYIGQNSVIVRDQYNGTTELRPEALYVLSASGANNYIGTWYNDGSISRKISSNTSYTYTFPNKTGTLAVTSDIPTDVSVSGWGYIKSYTESDPVFTASAAYDITAEDMTFWNNKSEITSIKMNGSAVNPTAITTHSYEVDLGTVITSHATHKLNATNGTASAVNQGTEITYVESVSGTTTATSGDLSVSTTRKKVTIPIAVTESTVSGWGFTKNTGTLTTETDPVFSASAAAGITSANITTWNGKQDAISDLATIRSNASTGAAKVSANNSTITIQKNGTTVDSFTTNASSDKTINIPNELPAYSASDANKILSVNSSGQLV